MATIAVGDVHGNLAALSDILDQIRGHSAPGDTVVFLGDFIDRGPDTKGCVDAILRFQSEVSAEVVCLVGNHEDWLLRTMRDSGYHSWLIGMAAFETIRSYSVDAERTLREAISRAGVDVFLGHHRLPYEPFFASVPESHLRFFEGLVPYYRTADCLCTHGGLAPSISRIQDQKREALIWGAGPFPYEYDGAEVVVYGHHDNATLDPEGWPIPAIVGRTIGIDTISHGVLTAVRLPDRHVFQSARCKPPDADV